MPAVLLHRPRTLAVLLGLLAGLAGTAGTARAQPPKDAGPAAAGGSGDSSVVAELEVLGRRPGPALWRVRRGESQVVILGGLSPLPHLLQWDTIRVEHALQGASVLFLPSDTASVGLVDGAEMVFGQGALRPRGGQTMEDGLTPALKARFDRVRDGIRADARRYQRWKPAIAGLLLLADFRRAAGLSEEKPGSTVAKMARANSVEIRKVGAFRAKPLFDAAARMTDAQNQACLAAALDDVEWEAAHARAAASAWAVGDLKGVRAHRSQALLDHCLLQLPSVQAVLDQGVASGVETIEAALKRPGASVAVIDLTFLLRADGVLDRLKARGDEVTVPAA